MARNKYYSRKVEYDGHTFDSKREAQRYKELKDLEEAHKISNLRLQVPFELIPSQRDLKTGKVIERACTYKADFVYFDNATCERVVEDTKGFKTKDYIIKRKLLLQRYGLRIREV